MKRQDRARALRALGTSVARIAQELGISEGYARNCSIAVERKLSETTTTVVRHGAHNGGCSTLSGMVPISMPRITALHGALA